MGQPHSFRSVRVPLMACSFFWYFKDQVGECPVFGIPRRGGEPSTMTGGTSPQVGRWDPPIPPAVALFFSCFVPCVRPDDCNLCNACFFLHPPTSGFFFSPEFCSERIPCLRCFFPFVYWNTRQYPPSLPPPCPT